MKFLQNASIFLISLSMGVSHAADNVEGPLLVSDPVISAPENLFVIGQSKEDLAAAEIMTSDEFDEYLLEVYGPYASLHVDPGCRGGSVSISKGSAESNLSHVEYAYSCTKTVYGLGGGEHGRPRRVSSTCYASIGDKISSVEIHGGYLNVTLYEHPKYRGSAFSVYGYGGCGNLTWINNRASAVHVQ